MQDESSEPEVITSSDQTTARIPKRGDTLTTLFEIPFQADMLPSMPEILLNLRSLLDDNLPPVREITRVILSDPGLTLRTLNLITRTEHFSRHNSTITVAKVINFFGLNPIRELLRSSRIFQDDRNFKQSSLFNLQAYWKHSIFAAFAAEALALELKLIHSETAYIAGLLHDVGKLAVARFAPELNFRLTKSKNASADHLRVEERILKTTHATIGGDLLNAMHMPMDITKAVAQHHKPHGTGRSINTTALLRDIIIVANYIAKLFAEREHSNHYFYQGRDIAHVALELSHQGYRRVVRQVGNQIYNLIDQFSKQSEGLTHYCYELEKLCEAAEGYQRQLETNTAKLMLREQETAILYELLPKLAKEPDETSLLVILARSIAAYTELKYVAVFLLDKSNQKLQNKVHFGFPKDDPMRWASIDLKDGRGVLATCFQNQEVFRIDAYNDRLPEPLYDFNEFRFVKSFPFAALPIVVNQESVGVLYLSYGESGKTLSEDLTAMVQKILNQIVRFLKPASDDS